MTDKELNKIRNKLDKLITACFDKGLITAKEVEEINKEDN